MTPITIKREQLARRGPTRGLRNPLETSTNFPAVWEGGEWGPEDIARIELIASMSLLDLASKFKDRYRNNARMLARANLKPKEGEPLAFVVPAAQPNRERVSRFLEILMWQGIKVHLMNDEIEASLKQSEPDRFGEIPGGSFIVMVNQAQKNNVLSLFEKQIYPERVNAAGEAEVPYDVSGWTLPLQMCVEYLEVWNIDGFRKNNSGTVAVEVRKRFTPVRSINQARSVLNLKKFAKSFDKIPNPLKTKPRIGLYKGHVGSMDEGWTRLVLDNHQINYTSVSDSDVRQGKLAFDSIILPSQSERQIVQGHSEERYPKEFTGGITKGGVDNLKKFVNDGGKLICFDDSCEMVINQFGLGMKNVLKGLNRKQFHSPGTILKMDLDTSHPISKGMDKTIPAYFIYSSAFEISDTENIKQVASYGQKDILLSGWIFGEKYINGKTSIAEAKVGQGRIILFGFRPQHRGQTYGTFPLIFNALDN